MNHYIIPSTEVQIIRLAGVLLTSPAEPATGGGGDQGGAQAPGRRLF